MLHQRMFNPYNHCRPLAVGKAKQISGNNDALLSSMLTWYQLLIGLLSYPSCLTVLSYKKIVVFIKSELGLYLFPSLSKAYTENITKIRK